MNKKMVATIVIIAIVVVGVIGGLVWLRNTSRNTPNDSVSGGDASYERSKIADLASQINYDDLDLNSIIPAQDINGNLPENVEGERDAPVVIYEYADYECSYCAMMNPYVNEIVDDYDGEVAVVLRTYILPYHSNSTMVSSAVAAAGIQGYWQKYKDLVFANQNDWYSLSGDGLQEYLEQYFVKVAGSKADLDKFREDMASEAVAQKLAFDYGAAEKMDIGGTPWFYLDGEWIENDGLSPDKYAEKIREAIDAKLKTLK